MIANNKYKEQFTTNNQKQNVIYLSSIRQETVKVIAFIFFIDSARAITLHLYRSNVSNMILNNPHINQKVPRRITHH